MFVVECRICKAQVKPEFITDGVCYHCNCVKILMDTLAGNKPKWLGE